jgi:hypothetical protein
MIRPGITREVTEPGPALTGNALTEAPALPGAHEQLARLAAHPQSGRDLFPLDEPPSLATVAARAYVAAAD